MAEAARLKEEKLQAIMKEEKFMTMQNLLEEKRRGQLLDFDQSSTGTNF